MADDAGEICCGFCCICCTASLQTWSQTTGWGSNGCCNSNRQAGCCNSCCGDSFDEDAFDKEVKKDMEKTRARTSADGKPMTTEQPTSGQTMTVPSISKPEPAATPER